MTDDVVSELGVAISKAHDSLRRDLSKLRSILWELSVSAAFPGVDYLAIFELPVFDEQTTGTLQRINAASAVNRPSS
jgi:hypothetical protein